MEGLLVNEAAILWLPKVRSQLIEKYPDAGKDWKQKENGASEGEMVRYHHWLNGQESEQSLENTEGQGSLTCCSQWGGKPWTLLSDWTTITNFNIIHFVNSHWLVAFTF